MCGLVGIAGDIYGKHKDLFGDLLFFDQLRGEDSTGVCFVDTDGEVNVDKEVGTPDVLEEHSSLYLKGNIRGFPQVLMGHNRAATLGKVTRENAHPFTFGDITGMHNGTLHDWSDLENYKTHDVDSKGIFDNISVHGIEDTWSKFSGAAALVWWDEGTSTLNLVRNNKRPLFYAWADKKKVFIWASEKWMIEVAASRADVSIAKGGIRSLPVDKLYSIEIKNRKMKKQDPVTMPEQLPEFSGYGKKAGFWRGYEDYWGGYNRKTSPNVFNTSSLWSSNTSKGDKSYVGQLLVDPIEVSRTVHGGDTVQFFRFKFDDPELEHERLEVYPNNKRAFDKLSDALYTRDLVCKLKGRPRVLASDRSMLRCSSDIVVMLPDEGHDNCEVHYPGPNGSELTYAQAEDALAKADNCCSYCGSSITPIDLQDSEWLDKETILCANCKSSSIRQVA